jgi:predicted  nucleic acid-binding Zn-ribbon protein
MKEKLLSILFLSIISLINITYADTTYNLQGYVYDVIYRKPLENATVVISKVSPSINIQVTITENAVYVNGNQVQVIQIIQVGNKYKIHIVYNDCNIIFFVKQLNITINITISTDCDSYVLQTDENGYWNIELSEGKYYINVSKDGYTSYLHYLEVKENNLTVTTYLLTLEKETELERRVDNLENQVKLLWKETNNIWNRIYEISENIDNINRDLLNRISYLNSLIQQTEENLKRALEQGLENARMEREILKQKIENEIENLRNDFLNAVNLINQQLNEVRSEINQERQLIIEIQDNFNSFKDIVSKTLEVLNSKIENIMLDIANLNNRLNVLELKVDEHEIRISNLELELRLFEEKINYEIEQIKEQITIPINIPKYSLTVYTYYHIYDNYIPYDNQYVYVLTYNVIPMDGYTKDGKITFYNIVADKVVVKYLDCRYEFILENDDVVRFVTNWHTYVVSSITFYSLEGENIKVNLKGNGIDLTFNVVDNVTYDFLPIGDYTITYNGKEEKITLTHKPMIIFMSKEKPLITTQNIAMIGGIVGVLAITMGTMKKVSVGR